MYADNLNGQPRFSDKPLIQPESPTVHAHSQAYAKGHAEDTGQPSLSNRSFRQPAKPSGTVYRSSAGGQAPMPKDNYLEGYRSPVNTDKIRQLLSSSGALPAIAVILLMLNHYDIVYWFLRGLGFIDIIALSCLAFSAFLAAPKAVTVAIKAFRTVSTAVTRLPEMADNIVTMSSAVELVQRHPAPQHWLDMYYNMVSDIDNMLQEMVKLRKLMADMHGDVEQVKEKTPNWIKKNSKNDRK